VAEGGTTWIAAARQAVDRASSVVSVQADLDMLAGYEDDLDHAIEELADLAQAAILGRGTWWAGTDAPSDLWTCLRGAQRDLKPRELGTVVRLLRKFPERIRREIQDAWRNHVAAQTGDASQLRELMQGLSGVEGLADISRRLDDALARLARVRNGLPDASAVQAFQQVVEMLDRLERRLPPAVKAFVSAAAHGGASIELLDAYVREWIVDNGAVGSFKVVPGSPVENQGG
jgi:hypothetical protein